MEFDHLFICVDNQADVADHLVDFGLTEGTSNQHPGQGTANRRFFFQNSFLEFLFVTDQNELLSEITRPTNLAERFSSESRVASPFGMCFRPSNGDTEIPFQSWSYKPQYLPQDLDVPVGQSPSSEPMWFYLSFGSRPDSVSSEKRQPIIHESGFENITSVKIQAPLSSGMSQPAEEVNKVTGVEFFRGKEHLVQVGFDSEVQSKQKDFRPHLPLILRW